MKSIHLSDKEILQNLLAAKGVTQKQTAEDVGIAESTISALLNGTRFLTRWQIGKVCKYFDVPPETFYPDTGDE